MLVLWKNAEEGASLWLEYAALGASRLRVCAIAGHGFSVVFKADLPEFIVAATDAGLSQSMIASAKPTTLSSRSRI
ncbi:hypothetical protein J1614_007977 [Plenodomus biglobosus]|nr:hypothetical protein J1614_007977 [Plenodomus biglobosus]